VTEIEEGRMTGKTVCGLLVVCAVVLVGCAAPALAEDKTERMPANINVEPLDTPGQTPMLPAQGDPDRVIRSYVYHIRALGMEMDARYNSSACGETLEKFLRSKGIKTALEAVVNWDRVPFAGTWGAIYGPMYSSAVTELAEALTAIKEDAPDTLRGHLADMADRIEAWDHTEQTIRDRFQQALDDTEQIAKLQENFLKAQSSYTSRLSAKYSKSLDKKMEADLGRINDEMAEIRQMRRGLFDEIRALAKDRQKFTVPEAALRLPEALKKPLRAESPPKTAEEAEKEEKIKAASQYAQETEMAAQRAENALEEAEKTVTS